MPFDIPAENKQHVNLSKRAWRVIEHDMVAFMGTDSPSLSGFLNRIITNFHENSNASINNKLDEEKLRLTDAFSGSAISRQIDTRDQSIIISIILARYKNDLYEKAISLPKGVGKKFRLNNENIELLTHEDFKESEIYGSLGMYLKVLFEDYARLSYAERESVYFVSIFETFKDAMNRKKCLAIKLKSGQRMVIRPYRCGIDLLGLRHYVIGYLKEADRDDSPIAIAYNDIDMIRVYSSASGFISEAEKSHLIDIIQSQSPAFFGKEPLLIEAILSEEGLSFFESRLENRPTLIGSQPGNIYRFSCSEEQAFVYFSSFGTEVEILRPSTLKKRLAQFHRRAAK